MEILYISTWSLLFIFIWKNMFYFDGEHYWTNSTNIWGDWSLHFMYIFNFLGRDFPLGFHPMYWGEPVRYHFVADFVSGLLLKADLSIVTATVLPSILSSILLITISYIFYKQVFKSTYVAVIAPILFFFMGGIGFVRTIYDGIINKDIFSEIKKVNLFTQNTEQDISWINFIIGEFLSQRGFLFGLPITIFILLILFRWHRDESLCRPNKLVGLGVLTGLLPIIHYHSFYAVLFVSAYLVLFSLIEKRKIKIWAWYYAPLIIVALIAYFKFIGFFNPTQLTQFNPGWVAPKNILGFFWFWFNNLGIVALLAPISYFFLPKNIRIFSIPFILLFILSSIFIFQRDPWDNRKFFVYWYFFSCGSVSYMLIKIWNANRKIASILIVSIFYTSIVSGLLDVIALPNNPHQTHRLFSRHDLQFAEEIRNKTELESVFLIAPVNSWFAMVLGRQIVMGFDIWLPNFGFTTMEERKKDIADIYNQSPEASQLINKYSIDYIVIGPAERRLYEINEDNFKSFGHIIAQNHEYTIYSVLHAPLEMSL